MHAQKTIFSGGNGQEGIETALTESKKTRNLRKLNFLKSIKK